MSKETMELLTNSRGMSFKTCRKKHWFEYELGLSRFHASKPLRIGSAVHEVLDHLKQGSSLEEALDASFSMYYMDSMRPEFIEPLEWDYEYYTMSSLSSAYQWYWGDSLGYEVIESEFDFSLPLINPMTGKPSRTFRLAGKIDGIIRLDDGRLAILEHKTTSDSIDDESDYWKRLSMDNQISLYFSAAKRMGYDVEVVIYDVIRKPTIRPTAVNVRDPDGKKIVVDIDGNRLYKKGRPAVPGGPYKSVPKDKRGEWKLVEVRGVTSVVDSEGNVMFKPDKPEIKPEPYQSVPKGVEGQVLTRDMMGEEWQDKLMDHIEENPERYYSRREIVRLSDEIKEMELETWELAQTIRNAQKDNLWYRTVHQNTCNFCSFFDLCNSKQQVDETHIPEGFRIKENLHEELDMEAMVNA